MRKAERKPNSTKIPIIKSPPYKQASRSGVREKPVTVGINDWFSSGFSSGVLVSTGRGVGVSTMGWSITMVGEGGKSVGVTVGVTNSGSLGGDSTAPGVGVSVGRAWVLATTTCWTKNSV